MGWPLIERKKGTEQPLRPLFVLANKVQPTGSGSRLVGSEFMLL